MKSSAPSITSVFYLTLACLTLLAAARQWLPQEGLATKLDLGAKQARAQSPGPLLPTTGTPNYAQPADAVPAASAYAVPNYAAPNAAPPPLPTTAAPAAPNESPAVELEATRVVARVGGDVILAGDVLSSVNTALARNGFDPKDPKLAEQKEMYFQMRLKQLIETRIILNEARRKIPPEGLKRASAVFDDEFNKNVVPKMLSDRKLPDLVALEEQLRREGSTLERERTAFAEAVLCNSWVSQNTKVSDDIPHHEMLQYYQEHSAEYDYVAQARWEQITIRFDAYPTKAEAYAALATAGNQLVDGSSFSDVARASSQGSTASQGGAHPWTKRGSLVSKTLDEALFTLPLGTLSPILEDITGFHIIRVIERRDAGRVPFAEAQVEIRRKIQGLRMEKAKKAFLDEIRKNAVVWTIYDDKKTPPTGTATNPSDANRYR